MHWDLTIQKKDMKKLNKTQQSKVEIARESIRKLHEVESIIYSNLVTEIEDDNDWIYDYVFNCTEEDAYTIKVRGEIFE